MKQLSGFIIPVLALMSFQTTPKKQTPVKPKTIAVTTAPVAGLKASLERGKIMYMKQCLACHQADGGGVMHLNAPLNGASAVVGKDKEKLSLLYSLAGCQRSSQGPDTIGENSSGVFVSSPRREASAMRFCFAQAVQSIL